MSFALFGSWPSALCALSIVSRVSADSLVLVPAGVDVGVSHHSQAGRVHRVGAEVSIVDVDLDSLLWFGAFAGAAHAGGAELAGGPELGVAVLGVDASPVWRESEPGHGCGWRSRAHVTWLFTTFYVSYGQFPLSRSEVVELGLHWKGIPLLIAGSRHPDVPLGTLVERAGWIRRHSRAR